MTDKQSRLKLAWRIGVPCYEPAENLTPLLAFFADFMPIVEEMAFFETITHHLYIPLDKFADRATSLGHALKVVKRAGVPSAGINVLTTMGHINEAWDYMPPLPMQPMVGHDGSVSRGCACPNTPELREYVRAKYTMVAEQSPDFVWVDDDIRMNNHGVSWACFCPTCLALFAEETGRTFTREALVAAFNDPAEGDVRSAWIDHNVSSIESLMADVEAAIHAVDPAIITGLMTAGPGWTTYNGVAFDRWHRALKATKCRPGGGFYSDERPLGMVEKAMEVGRQIAVLPPEITDVQYELEDFPYAVIKKSATAFISECTLALASGCNGIAFNALGVWDSAYGDFRRYLEAITAVRPVWEQFVAHADGLPTVGLWPAWSPRYMARKSVHPGEEWLAGDGAPMRPGVFAEIGLPFCTDTPADAAVLSGRIIEAFDDDELRDIFSRGVMIDSPALDILTERGLADLTGVRIAHRYDNGLKEVLTDDPLNGASAGHVRDCRIEFWGDARGMADVLEPTAPGVRELARMETYLYDDRGTCMTAFENSLGGRVVVMGYAPWIFFHSGAKRAQLFNLADWVTRGKLPVRVDDVVPLLPFARFNADRTRGSVVLLNACLDPLPPTTVHVRAADVPAALATKSGPVALDRTPEEGGWSTTIGPLEPWTCAVILIG
jgi:hypothetical protein